MVPLLADENFNHRVLRGLRRRLPTLDCLPAQETEVYQREDPEVLDWASLHNRVVLTHDVNRRSHRRTDHAPVLLLPGGVSRPRHSSAALTQGGAIEYRPAFRNNPA